MHSAFGATIARPLLAARLPIAQRTRPQESRAGLAFDDVGGPLVAVCGLVGGSGATSVAAALAQRAARESRAPVLLAELDSHAGGLTALFHQASALGLSELASQLATSKVPRQPFLALGPRLRLLAREPHPDPNPEPEAMSGLLKLAREAHGLVVLDCGTAWSTAAAAVLASATHVVWTLPTNTVALTRAGAVWSGPLAPKPGRWREALVASALVRRPGVAVRDIRRLAAGRCERIALVPFHPSVRAADDAPWARALISLAPLLRGGSR
jgi:hypothetical protein